jgi:hypothetical protein
MKKRFRFTMAFEAEVNERVNGRKMANKSKIKELLKEFVKDEAAVLDLYKLWLLGDLINYRHNEAVKKSIEASEEGDILKSVLPRCPQEVRQHFLKVLASEDDRDYKDLENFYEQFQMLQFTGASFEEVTE